MEEMERDTRVNKLYRIGYFSGPAFFCLWYDLQGRDRETGQRWCWRGATNYFGICIPGAGRKGVDVVLATAIGR
jgi:hypothetical protein